jgi:uncharacterized protein
MKIDYDPAKRAATLVKRRLDMAEANLVFEAEHLTFPDIRADYGEVRYLTVGHLRGRMVILCWTPRDDACRIISMRKTNERETKTYRGSFGIRT